MNYLLCVLTCGRPDYLARTLDTYARFLNPAPTAIYAWDDGGQTPLDCFHLDAWAGIPVEVESLPHRIGRCSGHANLWRATRKPQYEKIPWIWTVEDDVVLLRPLELAWIGQLLHAEPDLAQCALVRSAWGAEIEVGGYIPRFPDRYERRSTQIGPHAVKWIRSTVDWTSSPALLRSSLPQLVDWPGGRDCELTLGPAIQTRYPDACSGYWGWGEPYSSHIGLARVPGAFGY